MHWVEHDSSRDSNPFTRLWQVLLRRGKSTWAPPELGNASRRGHLARPGPSGERVSCLGPAELRRIQRFGPVGARISAEIAVNSPLETGRMGVAVVPG